MYKNVHMYIRMCIKVWTYKFTWVYTIYVCTVILTTIIILITITYPWNYNYYWGCNCNDKYSCHHSSNYWPYIIIIIIISTNVIIIIMYRVTCVQICTSKYTECVFKYTNACTDTDTILVVESIFTMLVLVCSL